MFETGSIISPRIFISTSIKTSKLVDGAMERRASSPGRTRPPH
jgi:hypothetical protein